MKKPYVYIITCLLGAFASLWVYFLYVPVVSQDSGATYYLRHGTSKKLFVSELTQQGIIHSSALYLLFIYPQINAHLKAGEYFFAKGSTSSSIWKQVTTGTGLLYRQFTIVPGWSFRQLRKQLDQTETLHHYTAELTDQQIMMHLGDASLAPEGEFFPETYNYTRGVPDLVILKRAFDLMQIKLEEAWKNRATGLPYLDSYQALIAASLIEKETYLSTESVIISGVLVNRLRKDMLLQFDPTVIYGLGSRYDGKLHKVNLLEDTAYNTYVHKGLPPTPISMPSMQSIKAALHPQVNDYLYFVAKGDGSHQFSKTLDEHNNAVRKAIQSHGNFNEVLIRGHMETFLGRKLNPLVLATARPSKYDIEGNI